jgi:hypothetical protein
MTLLKVDAVDYDSVNQICNTSVNSIFLWYNSEIVLAKMAEDIHPGHAPHNV